MGPLFGAVIEKLIGSLSLLQVEISFCPPYKQVLWNKRATKSEPNELKNTAKLDHVPHTHTQTFTCLLWTCTNHKLDKRKLNRKLNRKLEAAFDRLPSSGWTSAATTATATNVLLVRLPEGRIKRESETSTGALRRDGPGESL